MQLKNYMHAVELMLIGFDCLDRAGNRGTKKNERKGKDRRVASQGKTQELWPCSREERRDGIAGTVSERNQAIRGCQEGPRRAR